MALRDALASAAAAIFNVASDLCYDITYNQMGSVAYDPATGVANDRTLSTLTIASVVDRDSRKDIIGDHVENVDIIIIVLASLLVDITPKVGDTIVIDSRTRTVVSVGSDPAKISWELGLK